MMMLCRTFFFFFFAVVQACHPPDQMVVFHVEWPWVILEIFESQSATLTHLCCLPNPNHARSWGSAGSATSSCTSAYPKHKHLTNLLHDLWSYKQIFGLWGSDCFFASRPITRHTSLLEILLEAVVSKCQNQNLDPYLRGPCLAPSLAPHPPPCRPVAPPSRAPAPGRQSLASATGRTVRHVSNRTRRRHRTKNETVARQLILRRITWEWHTATTANRATSQGTDFAHWNAEQFSGISTCAARLWPQLWDFDFQVRNGKRRGASTLRFYHMSQSA